MKNTVDRRKKRIRAKVQGTSERPRLSVFRSNKHVYAQIINDETKQTLTGASEQELKLAAKTNKSGRAKVTAVVFDKGSYKYHGRVKAVAEGAREGGLKF
jgi:large subunit ribosomal protein L18